MNESANKLTSATLRRLIMSASGTILRSNHASLDNQDRINTPPIHTINLTERITFNMTWGLRNSQKIIAKRRRRTYSGC